MADRIQGFRHAKLDFNICSQKTNIEAIDFLAYSASKFLMSGVVKVASGSYNA